MKRIKLISAVLLIALSVAALSSCSIFDMSSSLGSGGDKDTTQYLTRGELDAILGEIEQNVTVNGGESYNVNITSEGNTNLLAASKALLSVVSIHCNFQVTVSYGTSIWGSSETYTTTKSTAGSGVIYSIDKNLGEAYIITNYHVVYYNGSNTKDGISSDIKLFLYGQEYADYAIPATYVGGSPNYDIAVLKVKGNNILRESNAAAATFADSNEISVLDTAIAIGNPEAKGISATVGSVNVDSEYIEMTSMDGAGVIELRVLRTDAAVNGGNSGGGLFNDKGELIGIVNAKMADTSVDNIGYAIPSNLAKYVADNIIHYDKENALNDSVFRILLGVSVGIDKAYSEYDKETGKVHKKEIVKVASVLDNSIVKDIVKVDDIINFITIDGVDYEIVRTFNLVDVMLTARKDSEVVLHVTRDGAPSDITVDLTEADLTKH